MNVLRQNLTTRLIAINLFILLICLTFYFLEFTNSAEAIREANLAEEPREPRGYGAMLAGSLAKACILRGVSLLITLRINRLRMIKWA